MTAVEWVIQYLNNVKPNEFCSIETIKEILEQAKEMEKEQIIDAYERGWDMGTLPNDCNAEQYYNEIYKKDNK